MKLLVVLSLCLFFCTAAAAQETRIAAIVNDDVVSLGDLNNRLLLIMRTSGIEDNAQNRARVSSQVLRTLIDEKLQIQEAKRLNIAVSADEVEKSVERLAQQNNMSKSALDDFLSKQGIPRSSLVDQVSVAITWQKLVRNRVAQDVIISEEEISEALIRAKEEADLPQSRIAEIFLAVDNPAQEDDVKRAADRLIEQIRGGVHFTAVAQQFSQSPTAAVGGDLGYVTPGSLLPELTKALQKMEPGQISYPLRTSGGFYILYLIDRRIPGKADPNNTVFALVEVVLPLTPAASTDEQRRVITEAQKISDTVKSCGELAKVGRDRAAESSREIPEIKAGDLPPAMRQAVLELQPAEASKPLPLPGGVGVVMVCQRTEPKGNLPTREEMTNALSRDRLDALARRYMRDLRRSAYVDIRG